MAAKSSLLGNLHELFAQYWMDRMTQKQDIYDAEGEVVDSRLIPLTAAEAAVLRAFLKDNNVQADPDSSKDVDALAAQLKVATKGTVETSELDAILADFNQTLSGTSLQ